VAACHLMPPKRFARRAGAVVPASTAIPRGSPPAGPPPGAFAHHMRICSLLQYLPLCPPLTRPRLLPVGLRRESHSLARASEGAGESCNFARTVSLEPGQGRVRPAACHRVLARATLSPHPHRPLRIPCLR